MSLFTGCMPSNLSSTEFVGERAVNYLRNVRDENQPFFLSVSFLDPHHPFTSCEDDYLRMDIGFYILQK